MEAKRASGVRTAKPRVAEPVDLKRHCQACSICAHPDLEDIEKDFVDWKSTAKICAEYNIDDRRKVARHANALGLYPKRQRNVRAALEKIIEKAGDVEVNAPTVVAAIQAYAKINAAGQWIDRSEHVNLNELFDRMSAEELEAYTLNGKLPDWFVKTTGIAQPAEEGIGMLNPLETKPDNRLVFGTFSTARPGDFPIGSLQSRAAARALLDGRRPRSTSEDKELQRCAEDPEHWLFRYALTKDEHDPSLEAKPFPDKPYLRELVRLWLAHRMNLVEKSRQLMASWMFCALYAWDAQFKMNRLNFIQSKKEEDSDRLVQRCFFIWEHQPEFIKRAYPAIYSYCHLRFFRPGHKLSLPYSEVWGIPQGADQIRQHTGSCLLVDEAAFNTSLEETIGAAKPMLAGGGRLDLVSSAEPGYFEQLADDKVK